ncbi:hypothetical protein [Pseudomonas farris]
MPWYKSGTVSVTQNSNAVIGTGTAFIANSRGGDAFRGPDGGWYEVTNIASDTAMSISPNYQGATNAAGAYALAPMQGYVKDSADALRAIVNTYGTKLAALGTTGNYDILPVAKGGTGLSALAATVQNLLVAEDQATARAAIGAVNPGIGYIDGLIPLWNSATSISISAGSAYIPGLSNILVSSFTLTLSGLSLSANTWYYVYLYSNAGTAAIELVTTAPAAAFSGTARTKAGDTSRRFVCALRSNAGTGLWDFQWDNSGYIHYRETINAAPCRILSGGTATAATGVSAAAAVPPTTMLMCGIVTGSVNPTSAYEVFLGLPAQPAKFLRYFQTAVGVFTRSIMTGVLLSSSQALNYWMSVSGGTVFIDVFAYGAER